MFIPNYSETSSTLRKIIFELAIRPEDSNRRLIATLEEYCTLCVDDFPIELQNKWIDIYSILTEVKRDDYRSTFYNSLKSKHKKTCSKIIEQIINLSINLDEYIKKEG